MPLDKAGLLQRFTRIFKGAEHKPNLRGEEIPAVTTQLGRDMTELFAELFGVSQDRFDAYRDYDDMEADSPIVCSALDAIADTAVSGAEGEAKNAFDFVFDKKNAKVSKLFDELDARTRLKSDAWKMIRSIAKYGEVFLEIVINPTVSPKQVSSLFPLPNETMVYIPEAVRRARGQEYAFEQWNILEGGKSVSFFPWQIVHFANKVGVGDYYGRSALYSARRAYRQLQVIEDSVVVNRLTRAVMRYKVTVPAPGMSATAAHAFVQKVKAENAQSILFDRNTGKAIISGKRLSEETDFYVADLGQNVKGDVEVLQGQNGSDRIEDVIYFQRKLFAAMRTPPSYLGWEQDTAGKAQIVTVDIAFARNVRRHQLTHGIGVRQVCDTELVLNGFDPKEVEYDILYPAVTSVDEMRRWQIELLKAQTAQLLKTTGLVLDDEYLLMHVLEIEEEYVSDLLAAIDEAKKKQEDMEREMVAAQGFGNFSAGGGSPVAGEGQPRPGQEDQEPALRGGSPSRTEQMHRLRESLKKRGMMPPREIHEAIRSMRTPRFGAQMRELYPLALPLKVSSQANNGSSLSLTG